MGSTRLPGKVLADLCGEPLLVRVAERARLARRPDRLVVATTTDAADDPIVELCRARGYASFRGHPTDVLDRYYRSAASELAETVVRITADCPLVDPGLIDRTIEALLQQQLDFAANRLPQRRTYPIGLDVEVCSFQALETAWREASEPFEREHVMPFLYRTPSRFRIAVLHGERDLGELRWTVDTASDLDFVRAVYRHFLPRTNFSWDDILELVTRQPELAAINAGVPHRNEFDVEPRKP